MRLDALLEDLHPERIFEPDEPPRARALAPRVRVRRAAQDLHERVLLAHPARADHAPAEPVADAAPDGVERGVRRVDRDAARGAAQEARAERAREREGLERGEDRRVVRDDEGRRRAEGLVDDGFCEAATAN